MARLALVHWLEFWGLRVHPFTAAGVLAGALRNASPASRPDAVILGLKPRELVDADVLAALSACKGGSPPLLALVASAALPVHEAVRQAGAAACLPKSVGRQRLHEELLRLLTENAAGAEPPLQGRRAVIADNNRPNRAYIATLCRHLGLSIREADDGAEALALWRQHKPEIVLLDARMPVMDGPSCARAIRAEEQAAGVNGQASRILAVSAYLEIEERREFLDAGADEILLKPFDETQLLRALAPLAGAPPARQAARLAADPELLELLREELPQQFADLEKTMGTGDLPAARDAAHTLRGTAAFYHLARLRQTTAALEDGLKGMEKLAPGGLPRDLENVRRAVQETLDAL
jgi:two-component system sensor histidine kinase BarA